MSEVNYAYSLNGEEYYGEFASREAAIAEAEEVCGHDGYGQRVVWAQEEFVRVPYGASHEDVAQINEWHKMAQEARAALAALERGDDAKDAGDESR